MSPQLRDADGPRKLEDRLERIVASFVDPDQVPGWQLMVRDIRDEPIHPDPPCGEFGIEALPWCTAWEALTFRRCVARREVWGGRCDLRVGHDCDHAIEQGMHVMRWSTRLTNPPLIRTPAPPAPEDEDLDEIDGED